VFFLDDARHQYFNKKEKQKPMTEKICFKCRTKFNVNEQFCPKCKDDSHQSFREFFYRENDVTGNAKTKEIDDKIQKIVDSYSHVINYKIVVESFKQEVLPLIVAELLEYSSLAESEIENRLNKLPAIFELNKMRPEGEAYFSNIADEDIKFDYIFLNTKMSDKDLRDIKRLETLKQQVLDEHTSSRQDNKNSNKKIKIEKPLKISKWRKYGQKIIRNPKRNDKGRIIHPGKQNTLGYICAKWKKWETLRYHNIAPFIFRIVPGLAFIAINYSLAFAAFNMSFFQLPLLQHIVPLAVILWWIIGRLLDLKIVFTVDHIIFKKGLKKQINLYSEIVASENREVSSDGGNGRGAASVMHTFTFTVSQSPKSTIGTKFKFIATRKLVMAYALKSNKKYDFYCLAKAKHFGGASSYFEGLWGTKSTLLLMNLGKSDIEFKKIIQKEKEDGIFYER